MNMLKFILINTRLGESRGVSRIWLEGRKLSSAFEPGQRLKLCVDPFTQTARLTVSEDGVFVVSKRTKKNGAVLPLIEVRDQSLLEVFGQLGALLRVVIKSCGEALIETHKINQNIKERIMRLKTKARSGEPLSKGSLCSGGGILDAAISEGLKDAGFDSYVKFAVEQERKYLDTMLENQPNQFREDSILIESPIEYVELRNPPTVDCLIMGLPCTGASRAGATRNKISMPELHKKAGAIFHYALQFVKLCQPIYVVFENVLEYAKSASMAVIASVLDNLGYDLRYMTLNGNEFGSLENRDRLCVVATTRGLKHFDTSTVKPLADKPDCIADVLDDVPLDDERWRTYDYLVLKEERDRKAGKGFKRALLTSSDTSVPTIRRLYHKAGSTDPFLVHPVKPELSRLFTGKEVAKLMGIPLQLVRGVSNTVMVEICGQSVSYLAFKSVGLAIGQWIENVTKTDLCTGI